MKEVKMEAQDVISSLLDQIGTLGQEVAMLKAQLAAITKEDSDDTAVQPG